MTLRQAKTAVREDIRTFTDQKLAEVYAFNPDGKMSYGDGCACIIGVASSDVLHFNDAERSTWHYLDECNKPECVSAERGYLKLATIGTISPRSVW
jgi:hypothetical protein